MPQWEAQIVNRKMSKAVSTLVCHLAGLLPAGKALFRADAEDALSTRGARHCSCLGSASRVPSGSPAAQSGGDVLSAGMVFCPLSNTVRSAALKSHVDCEILERREVLVPLKPRMTKGSHWPCFTSKSNSRRGRALGKRKVLCPKSLGERLSGQCGEGCPDTKMGATPFREKAVGGSRRGHCHRRPET